MKSYRILVKGGRTIAGFAQDGARLQVMPGEYDGLWLTIARGQDPALPPCLRLIGADKRGGDLDVRREEYEDDLAGFPDLSGDSKFQILE